MRVPTSLSDQSCALVQCHRLLKSVLIAIRRSAHSVALRLSEGVGVHLVLFSLGTIDARRDGDALIFSAKLDWPTLMTDTEFFRKLKDLPHSRTNIFSATE